MFEVKEREIVNDLIQFEKKQVTKQYKFGILYRKLDQNTEEELFGNGKNLTVVEIGTISRITLMLLIYSSHFIKMICIADHFDEVTAVNQQRTIVNVVYSY